MRKIRKGLKVWSIICAITLMISMCSVFALAVGTYSNPIDIKNAEGNVISSYDNDKTPPAHDISVMSYNVLQANSSDQLYASVQDRLDAILEQIAVYEPDILCVQEAANETVYTDDDGNPVNWADTLTNALTVGDNALYTALRLDAQVTDLATTAANGLIIFYKKDRFTLATETVTVTEATETDPAVTEEKELSGYKQYTNGSDRYYQWIKLRDDDAHNNTEFYVYNTHLAASGTNAQKVRTLQIQQLFDNIESTAKGYPFFVLGDFNTTLTADYKTAALTIIKEDAIKAAEADAAAYAKEKAPTDAATAAAADADAAAKEKIQEEATAAADTAAKAAAETAAAAEAQTAAEAAAAEYLTNHDTKMPEAEYKAVYDAAYAAAYATAYQANYDYDTKYTELYVANYDTYYNSYYETLYVEYYDTYYDNYYSSTYSTAYATYLEEYTTNNYEEVCAEQKPQEQLGYLTTAGYDKYISDAAVVADSTVSAGYSTRIDHIFINDNYLHAIEHRAVQENTDGRATSDHFALVAYCNFAAAVGINGASYDETDRTYTATSDSAEFTFNVADLTDGKNLNFYIDGADKNGTVTLTEAVNTFTLTIKADQEVTATVPPADTDIPDIDDKEDGGEEDDEVPDAKEDETAEGEAPPEENTEENTENTTDTPEAQAINTVEEGVDETQLNTINTVTLTVNYTGAKTATVAATGAINTYFANNAHQIVLANSITSTKIRVTDGTLYAADDAELATPLDNPYTTAVTPGRKEFVVKAADGSTYPLYLYQATQQPESDKVFYVDDDMGTTGTVAYYNGTDVVLVKAGIQGFDTIQKAATKCNSTGYTIYVGTGNYKGNTTGFAYGITLLGANANTSALTQDKQLNTERNEETVINGRIFIFTRGSYTYTVKGFSFEGNWDATSENNASIYITYNNSYLNTNAAIAATVTLNIRNNIFTSYGNAFNDAVIRANSAVGKAGIISDNYFKYNGNEGDRDNRGMQMRNINGLIIENNRFVNFPSPMWLSSEYSDGQTDLAANANYTIQNNTFEACGSITNYIVNAGEGASAHMKYYNNNFIRCGYATDGEAAIHVTLKDTKTKNDFENISLAIQGNQFLGCFRSIGIERRTTSRAKAYLMGNMQDMKVNINRNLFYQPQERHSQANQLASTINFSFFVSGELADGNLQFGQDLNTETSHNWNLAYNYFESPILIKAAEDSTDSTQDEVTEGETTEDENTEDETTVPYPNNVAVDKPNDPINFIHNQVSGVMTSTSTDEDGAVTTTTATQSGLSFYLTADYYSPYYTDATMTTLEYDILPKQSITVADQQYNYDGNAHGVAATIIDKNGADVTAECTVIYCDTEDGVYGSTIPTFTEVGSYTVYYQVERAGYAQTGGSYTITIVPTREISIESKKVTYDGNAHSLDFTPAESDTVSYIYNGEEKTEMPTFTDVGVYEVTVKVTNALLGSAEATGTLTINMASLDDIAISGYEGYYDGMAHGVTVGALPKGVTATYVVDGKEENEALTYTAPCTHTVTVTLSSTNYVTRSETVTINIVAAIITGITITPYVGEVNGQSHGVTVEGTQAGDEVYYAYGGGDYTTTEPAFTEEGIYSVTVKITRENYQDKISVVTVVIDESEKADYIKPLFSVTNGSFGVTQAANGKYTFNWTCKLAFTDFGKTALNNDNYRVLSYGVKYAPSLEYLEEYVYRYQAYGFDEKATGDTAVNGKISGEVAEIAVETASASGNNPGLTNLYQTTKYNLNSLSEVRARYAMSYVRYYDTATKTVYEEYGAIEIAISNYLPNGTMKGIGGTEEREDILGTNPNEGETSEREDILGK